jgi:hypothetical protein
VAASATSDSDAPTTPDPPLFPGSTEWEFIQRCWIPNIIRTLPNRALYLGHWRISPGMPVLVSILIFTSYIFAMLFIIPYRGSSWFFLSLIFSLIFFIFSYCYFRIIIDGPGYFPFFLSNGRF